MQEQERIETLTTENSQQHQEIIRLTNLVASLKRQIDREGLLRASQSERVEMAHAECMEKAEPEKAEPEVARLHTALQRIAGTNNTYCTDPDCARSIAINALREDGDE